LDDLIEASREELKEECNYLIEAEKQKKYISHFGDRPGFKIPEVIDSLSTQHILTMEFLDGVDMQTCAGFPQEIRNSIGARILESTIREIFEVKFMQTDPNPANFFYNTVTGDLNLLDFGAARGYSEEFVNEYLQTVYGASNNDAALVLRSTTALGFLTGEESKVMIEAHIESVLVVGLPFSELGEFDFGNQGMTKRIYKLMPVMMKNRLKAPPKEVYSLHRKLAGAYLLNMMLKTKIPARGIFHKVLKEINPAWLKGKVLKS
jgi:aarF domain-containing kinase